MVIVVVVVVVIVVVVVVVIVVVIVVKVDASPRRERSPSPPALIVSSNATLIEELQTTIQAKRVFDNLTPKLLRNHFISIDRDGYGRVDAEDVQFVLRKIGVGITPLQAEDIVNSLSSEGNELVYYDDLVMVLFNHQHRQKQRTSEL